MPGRSKLVWRSKEVVDQVLNNVSEAYTEFGLVVERYSKQELTKGHGVLTGTARRSIHTAEPGYDWSRDDVDPGKTSPERGGKAAKAKVIFGKVSLLIGSGLKYALPLHQGHHGFQGYHFLVNGLTKAKPELKAILEKHRMKG